MNIEPLESRIAPATFTFGDVDGDFVTVATSKGTDAQLAAIIAPFLVVEGLGMELQRIDLSAAPTDATGRSIFHGTNLVVTAVRTSVGGDGMVNVGYVDASVAGGGTALDLGTVIVRGDLGQIDAGDATTTTPAVRTLDVRSMGQFGASTQGAGASLQSDFNGRIDRLLVRGNVEGAFLNVGGGADGRIGSVTIGGSLIGGAAGNSGAIVALGDIGPVKIGGHLDGGGISAGRIASFGKIGSVTIGGSIFGGTGSSSGTIVAASALGAVRISGDLAGGSGEFSGRIAAATVSGVTILGSLTGGSGDDSGGLFATVAIGTARILGDLDGGVGERSGRIDSDGGLAAVVIDGSLAGGSARDSGQILAVGDIGSVRILKNIVGGSDVSAGNISGARLGSVNVGGSVRGGNGPFSASIQSVGAMGPVTIGGNLQGGSGPDSGSIDSGDTLARVTIGGSLIGGAGGFSAHILSDEAMGSTIVRGDVRGGSGTASCQIRSLDTLGAVTIGGSLTGGTGADTGALVAEAAIGAVRIAGDVQGGSGAGSGSIVSVTGGVAGVTIGGSLLGGSADDSGRIEASGDIGPVRIAENIIGGSVSAAVTLRETGSILAGRIASLFVGGSIIAGTESGGGLLIDSGAVRAHRDIGPVTIKGSLIGNNTHLVFITAAFQTGGASATDLAIRSLNVTGRVELAEILAGFTRDDIPFGLNPDAQIGPVIVGGDWIASDLVAGVQDDAGGAFDTFFGDANDRKITAGADDAAIVSKIASILIKGQALGTIAGGDHFGFVAQQIGSFKVGVTTFPLTAGAANDLAGLLVGAPGDVRVREVAL